jgi:hypothetical protein
MKAANSLVGNGRNETNSSSSSRFSAADARQRRRDHEVEDQQGDRDREHVVAEGLQPPVRSPRRMGPEGGSPLAIARI